MFEGDRHVRTSIDRLISTPFPEAYKNAARNAVEVCLRVKPGEKVVLITDEACLPIGASMASNVAALGNRLEVFVLEEMGSRPMITMPQEILDALTHTDVSIYACKSQAGELRHRIEMMSVINLARPRHGHMVNINHAIMIEGMQADFVEVDRISQRVYELASKARTITATTARGTDIEAVFSPNLKWLKTSGIITADKWGNLPGGETFTAPENVNGVYVVDGVVGDYLCEKYGDLRETPLTIEIENNRIRRCACDNTELLEEFTRYCTTDANSNRVGEFAIGTNIACANIIGHILQDEKIPGVHVAFGHPYAEHTGADWASSTHIDVVGRSFNIRIDGRQIMKDGAFTEDVLS